MSRLREHLEEALDERELAASLGRVEDALVRRRSFRRMTGGGLVLATVASMALASYLLSRPATPDSIARPEPVVPLTLPDGRTSGRIGDAELDLTDGSHVSTAPASRLTLVAQRDAEVVFELEEGRARFDVRPGGPRRWTIRAGALTVRVLGTSFTVERDDLHTGVLVHRGVVVVDTGVETRRLYAGERFELVPVSEEASGEIATAQAVAEVAHEAAQLERPTAPSGTPSRPLEEALEAPPTAPRSEPRSELADLLERADDARREGRSADAIAALRVIVERHPTASEAPSAAVALGHVQRQDGHYAEAAEAYRRALALGAPPALAELCYEWIVRAEMSRGADGDARRAFDEYRRRFPDGQRTPTIEAILRGR
jgi:transmembrane sensor